MTQILDTWKDYTLPEELKEPQKLPTPTSFGGEWAIVATGAKKPTFWDLFFILLWLSITAATLWPQFHAGLSNLSLTTLFMLSFAVFGLSMLYGYGRKWWLHLQSNHFGSPILLLDQERYRPGDMLRLSFQRDIKPNTEVGAGTLSARLVCVEVTRRTVGTDTSYDHAVHYEKDLGQQPTFGGQHQLRALWHGDIPAVARPSQLGTDHWLVWEVQVRQHLLGQLDETTSFLIPVVN
ncbi:hypothetical protein [Deinococcus sp.]|uniref:hypothetical protein n=1 Tax=Deinococcus sp. TaxID=47478 RepID=UPI0025BDB601|nr:hypothetical protein [Deinococcus sp.]